MTQKKILEKLDIIDKDVNELKTSQKLIEKDVHILRTNHLHHIEKNMNFIFKWSLVIGILIILMFVDETQTLISNYLTK